MKTKIVKMLWINPKSCLIENNIFELCATEHFFAPCDLKNFEDTFKNKKTTMLEKIFVSECINFSDILSDIALIDRHGIAYNKYGRTCYDIVVEFSYSTIVFELVYNKRSGICSLRLYATPEIMEKFIEYVNNHQDILGDYIKIVEREERSNA